MAKSSYDDWDTTAGNNLDIGGISIAENCPAANINNAIRELMAQLKTLNIATTDDTPGRLLNIQTFTSSGTYTPSSGVGKAHIKMVGAGGGGGGADSDSSGTGETGVGSGGGAGGYVEGYLDVSGGSYTATITIGTGGTAGDVSGGTTVQPGDGGDTVYSDGTVTWTAGGGLAGETLQDSAGDAARGGNGGGVNASGALFSHRGAAGENGTSDSTSRSSAGGVGGSTIFGGGGRGGIANADGDKLTGNDGNGYGAGGGGAASAGLVTSAAGGVGAPGFVIIYEYA